MIATNIGSRSLFLSQVINQYLEAIKPAQLDNPQEWFVT
jgi:hypothetical protein